MKHARMDYDVIQDPRPDGIGEDEPVFLLRAKDLAAPDTVRYWADVAETLGTAPEVVARVREWAYGMEAWQRANVAKVPDVPDGMLREEE